MEQRRLGLLLHSVRVLNLDPEPAGCELLESLLLAREVEGSGGLLSRRYDCRAQRATVRIGSLNTAPKHPCSVQERQSAPDVVCVQDDPRLDLVNPDGC